MKWINNIPRINHITLSKSNDPEDSDFDYELIIISAMSDKDSVAMDIYFDVFGRMNIIPYDENIDWGYISIAFKKDFYE